MIKATWYYILDYMPQYMGLELQEEQAAGMITKLEALEFLCRCRPGVSEGAVSQEVMSFSIADALRDSETGQYQFPDPASDAALIAEMQQRLAARSGIPVTSILKEQETRLADGISRKPSQPQTLPAEEVREQQPSQLPDGIQLEPSKAKTNPSRPTLDDKEQTLLAFLIEHPDMPISGVSKALRIRQRK